VGNPIGGRLLPTAPCGLRISGELRHELLLVRLHDKLACQSADFEIRRQQSPQGFHALLHWAHRWRFHSREHLGNLGTCERLPQLPNLHFLIRKQRLNMTVLPLPD